MATQVFKFRVKSLEGSLRADARKVNQVWNFCNETQQHAVRLGRSWLSAFDLINLTSGSSKLLGLHSGTIEATCQQYAKSRLQHRKRWLRFRGARSLGWVPFKGRDIRLDGDAVVYTKKRYRFFKSRVVPTGKIRDGGCFVEDAKGRWYVCIPVEVQEAPIAQEIINPVGIDLGLHSLATLSTGETIEAPQHFRKHEAKLAAAQRAKKKRLARSIHAKIRNARQDHLHKVSTRIVRTHDAIIVGDVKSSNLTKTRMAKSVLDAGWGTFKNMLRYKARTHGAYYEEVSEKLTSQTCSSCGALPPERPKGIAGLGIRHWTCSACGATHNRDINAAINILARSGHRALVEGA